jgi:hypothetical protein
MTAPSWMWWWLQRFSDGCGCRFSDVDTWHVRCPYRWFWWRRFVPSVEYSIFMFAGLMSVFAATVFILFFASMGWLWCLNLE